MTSIDEELRGLARAAADEVADGIDIEAELRALHRTVDTAPLDGSSKAAPPDTTDADTPDAVVTPIRRQRRATALGIAAAAVLVVGGFVAVVSLDGGDDDSADAPLRQRALEADDTEAPAETEAAAESEVTEEADADAIADDAIADEEMSDDAAADDGTFDVMVEEESPAEESPAEESAAEAEGADVPGPVSVEEVGRRAYRRVVRPAIRLLRDESDFAGRSFDATEGGILVVRIVDATPARIAEVEELLAEYVTDAVVVSVDP